MWRLARSHHSIWEICKSHKRYEWWLPPCGEETRLWRMCSHRADPDQQPVLPWAGVQASPRVSGWGNEYPEKVVWGTINCRNGQHIDTVYRGRVRGEEIPSTVACNLSSKKEERIWNGIWMCPAQRCVMFLLKPGLGWTAYSCYDIKLFSNVGGAEEEDAAGRILLDSGKGLFHAWSHYFPRLTCKEQLCWTIEALNE